MVSATQAHAYTSWLLALPHMTLSKLPIVWLCAGAGKSLCYQLPALVLPGTVLVVSPLLALMQDQLAHVPACIPAAMLGSSLAPEATRAALDRLQARPCQAAFLHVAC